jgi:3-phenylpropionate/cinnamic acid dioxygenase small subunit
MGYGSERAEIENLYSRYAWALVDRDWPAWEACFTADAKIDNTSAGGVVGTPADVAAFLATTFEMFEIALNAVSNLLVDFEDDASATSRAMFTVTMKVADQVAPTYMEARGWYRDRLMRTDHGWRVAERVETLVDVRSPG